MFKTGICHAALASHRVLGVKSASCAHLAYSHPLWVRFVHVAGGSNGKGNIIPPSAALLACRHDS